MLFGTAAVIIYARGSLCYRDQRRHCVADGCARQIPSAIRSSIVSSTYPPHPILYVQSLSIAPLKVYLVPDLLALPQTPQILSAYPYAALEVLQKYCCQPRMTPRRAARAHTMTVLPLSCGVRSTSFLAKSGWPSGSGSSSATSSAAPAIFFSSRALSKAFLNEDQGHSNRDLALESAVRTCQSRPPFLC